MAQTSFALMTNTGRAKEAAALANGTTIQITHIAIGDGTTVPSGGETALYHEVARKTISGHGTVVGAMNVAYFDCFLAAADGPYTIREAGLIDIDGDLIAIAKYDPPISKPTPDSGQTVEGMIRLEVAFSDVANVTIKIDPSMQVALQRLTRLPWVPVKSMTLAAPPAGPAIGDTYLIPAAPTGVWAGQAGKIAEFGVAGWAIISPPDGHGIGLPDGRQFVRRAGTYHNPFVRSDIVVSGWRSDPPAGLPAEGDCYVVYTSAAGAWAGQEQKLAVWRNGAWAFDTPLAGMMVQYWAGTRPVFLVFTGVLWIEDAATTTMPGRVQLATEQDVKDAVGDFVVQAKWLKNYTRSLLASSTFYIRPDGNDNNDGSANDAAHAFKTLAGALAYIRNRYGVPGRPITFKLAAGTYAFAQIGNIPAGLTIEGDVANQGAYILEGPGGMGVSGATVDLKGLTLSLTGVPTQHTLTSGANGSVNLTNVTFGGVGQTTWSHILAAGGQVTVLGGANSVSFTSNARRAIHVSGGGGVYMATGSGLYFSIANYNYNDAVVFATTGGTVELGNGSTSGSAIGKRYRVDLNGVISTAGGGENFIPGSIAGTKDTGGQYV